jgi:pimeloyl-ACP methyl ester carboxylesterase
MEEALDITKRIRIVIKWVGIALGILYLTACLFLYIFQNKFLYYPREISILRIQEISKMTADIEEVTIEAADGENLKGWVVNKDNENVVYYFGGNAEEVSDMIEQVNDIKNCAFVIINYRGYGESTGKPSQKNLFSDAVSIYDHCQKKFGYSNVTIMGRSLGSGIAIDLASQEDVNGLILVTPYDSMVNLAKERFPRFLPIGFLLHERYESIDLAEQIGVPTLILMAQCDNVVPNKNTINLIKGLNKNNVQLIEIPEAGHNSISQSEGYWDSIKKFLAGVQ